LAAAYVLNDLTPLFTAAIYYDTPTKSVTMSAIQPIFTEHKFNQTIKSEKAVRQV